MRTNFHTFSMFVSWVNASYIYYLKSWEVPSSTVHKLSGWLEAFPIQLGKTWNHNCMQLRYCKIGPTTGHFFFSFSSYFTAIFPNNLGVLLRSLAHLIHWRTPTARPSDKFGNSPRSNRRSQWSWCPKRTRFILTRAVCFVFFTWCNNSIQFPTFEPTKTVPTANSNTQWPMPAHTLRARACQKWWQSACWWWSVRSWTRDLRIRKKPLPDPPEWPSQDKLHEVLPKSQENSWPFWSVETQGPTVSNQNTGHLQPRGVITKKIASSFIKNKVPTCPNNG